MKKRSPKAFFDLAEANGHDKLDETVISGDLVLKDLAASTEKNYSYMLGLWDEYEKRNPGADLCDLKTAKHFLHGYLRGCEAHKTAQRPSMCLSTIHRRWIDLTSAWQRRLGGRRIVPPATVTSVTAYIDTVLKQDFNLSIERRVRHYLTVPHFKVLLKHLWQKDWYNWHHSRSLVQDHAAYLLCIYTSARIGEYFESSARPGSGRGLLYKHIDFVIFRNEKGNAEIAIRVMRDAKGRTNQPHKRPKHGVYEDIEPLYINPVLPLLAIALADDAFVHYRAFAEIEQIPPPVDGSMYPLQIKEEMLTVPFFQGCNRNGPTGKICSANVFGQRTRELGHRAGYEENITIHDIRAEVLVRADDHGYSAAQRMKFAGHDYASTFYDSYMSQMSTVDGISSYWNRERRATHIEGFRGLSLHHHPQMLQTLPAKVEVDLAMRADFIEIEAEIKKVGQTVRGVDENEIQSARARRDELYRQKVLLISEELKKWQKLQRQYIKPDADGVTHTVASLSTYFNRIRRLDSRRDRLATSLFLEQPLRSMEGRRALEDMISLCKEDPPVAYRSSLRPDNGGCPSCNRRMEIMRVENRWMHIYSCYTAKQQKQHGFAKLCFHCDEWVTSKESWHEHCQLHLNDIQNLPVQCNPLSWRYTLATAGYCLFCLYDELKSATERFYQFTLKREWWAHVQEHFQQLEEWVKLNRHLLNGGYEIACPDPRCDLACKSTIDLRLHCQDIHGVEVELGFRKRPLEVEGTEYMQNQKRVLLEWKP